MASMTFTEVREELAAKRKNLHDIFQEAGPDLDLTRVHSIHGDTEAKAAEIRRMNEELSDLGREYDRLYALEQIGKSAMTEYKRMIEPASALPTGGSDKGWPGDPRPFQPRRLRETLLESKGYKAFRDGTLRTVTIDVPAPDIKTLVTLTTINRQNERLANVPMALEERTIADLMLQGNTDANTL